MREATRSGKAVHVGRDKVSVFALVRRALLALRLPGVTAEDIKEDSRLFEDLGVSSLELVELTTRLEDELGIEEFPMQRWADRQMERQQPLTAGALATACIELRDGIGPRS